jgi:hypothetical protein
VYFDSWSRGSLEQSSNNNVLSLILVSFVNRYVEKVTAEG